MTPARIAPVLDKLYLIRPLASAAVDFLNALLPEADKVVVRELPDPS
jgi:hypothetical protein